MKLYKLGASAVPQNFGPIVPPPVGCPPPFIDGVVTGTTAESIGDWEVQPSSGETPGVVTFSAADQTVRMIWDGVADPYNVTVTHENHRCTIPTGSTTATVSVQLLIAANTYGDEDSFTSFELRVRQNLTPGIFSESEVLEVLDVPTGVIGSFELNGAFIIHEPGTPYEEAPELSWGDQFWMQVLCSTGDTVDDTLDGDFLFGPFVVAFS